MSVVKFFSRSLLALMLVAVAPAVALAAPITGTLIMTGDVAPTGGTSGTLADATGLAFPGNDFAVTYTSGDFATLVTSSTGSINDLSFDPFAAVDPLWTIDGVSFTLGTLTVQTQTDASLMLTGTGFIHAAGYDDTFGVWGLTGYQDGISHFAFVSSATGAPVAAVPEPTSAAVFAAGWLLVAGAIRRSR